MSFFVTIFKDKLADDREPWISGLEIPGVSGGSFDVYAPNPGPWIQLAAVRDDAMTRICKIVFLT
jgi:hypothetical protein